MHLMSGFDDPKPDRDSMNGVLPCTSPGSLMRQQRPAVDSAESIACVTADFESVRARLIGIAYRILGGAADAEDVVQDVWIRWQRTDRSGVRDWTAFLVTTTTRVALNVSTSARARHELPIGDGIVEAGGTLGDPAADAELSEALELAIVQLLERLSPVECAVFVLREGFDYPFRTIAEALRIGEPNARQLARRARIHLAGQRRMPMDRDQYGRLLAAFRGASNLGELSQLEQLLIETVGRQEAA